MIGLALVLRDLVQRRLGRSWSLGAVAVGAILSGAIAPASLVVASAVAFFFSEFADFSVYTPLQRRRFVTAVVASSMVGLVVDSLIFLWLAFSSLEFFWGQVVGKAWMVLISLPFIYWLRVRDSRMGITQDASA
ncbi:MAG: VUT family protein [Chloroflexota bacterium]